MITKETQLIWHAAGKPVPCDTYGAPIPPARGEREKCARCGAPEGDYSHNQVVSTSFMPTRNANRLRTYYTNRYCQACVFCAKSLRLRCISWFATENGVWFWRIRPSQQGEPQPDGLATLLDPPKPPFVVGVPLYGIAHGGEGHWKRTWWPGEPMSETPLIRLQSKHVALYSRISLSRDRYPVQVDDQQDFMLDRDVWLWTRDAVDRAIAAAVQDGIRPYAAKMSLLRLELPKRASTALAATWRPLVRPLRSVYQAQWWPLFLDLFPTPKEA